MKKIIELVLFFLPPIFGFEIPCLILYFNGKHEEAIMVGIAWCVYEIYRLHLKLNKIKR